MLQCYNVTVVIKLSLIDDGYLHESGNYVIYKKRVISGERKMWVVSDEMDGEVIVMLGSAQCPPGEFSGLKVETTADNAAQCNCPQEAQDDCNTDCIQNPDEHAVCKCISTGFGDQCISCPPGTSLGAASKLRCINMSIKGKSLHQRKVQLVPIFHAKINATKTVSITPMSTAIANASALDGVRNVSNVSQVCNSYQAQ